jgi:hypothetical protein
VLVQERQIVNQHALLMRRFCVDLVKASQLPP